MNLEKELKPYKKLVEDEIWRYLNQREKPRELYDLLKELFRRGGKRIRPVMALLCCEAMGGECKKTIKTATSIEMIHNFSLIHDDIVDLSELRRGEPCLHHMFGEPLAINAGDGLFSLAFEVLVDNFDHLDDKTAKRVFKIMANVVTHICEGQAMDISWSKNKRHDITEEDYFRMLEGKTGGLISASCEAGAVIGGGNEKKVEALTEFGHALGIAFQIHDDVLNLTGSEERYGKEIGGDINEGKRSLITIYTLNVCTPEEKKRLTKILDKERNSNDEVNEALDIINSYGSIERATKKANDLIREGKSGLDSLPDSHAKSLLLEIADYFVRREV